MAPSEVDGIISIDRLKDHYKHCIKLSASNKINPKNAFDLQLIDYMQDLVSGSEGGPMNFKIASSALDVGAKIYSSRVDRIQSEAQKVASSILMALDGQAHPSSNNDDSMAGDTTENGGDMNDSNDCDGDAQRAKKKKRSRSKNVKTVVEDPNALDAKLENIVLGDAFLDGLSRDYDMSCPAALISYNSLTQPNCLLTVDSNNTYRGYKEPSAAKPTSIDLDATFSDPQEQDQPQPEPQLRNPMTLIMKNANCAQIIRDNMQKPICPRLENFLFNDTTTTISGWNSNDDSIMIATTTINQPMNSTKIDGGAHEFNPEFYEDHDNHMGDPDSGAEDDENIPEKDRDVNDDMPNLDRIAASKPTEYVYSAEHHRLLNTWAGPHAWKPLKAPTTSKDVQKSARKRIKLELKPINFEEDYSTNLEELADKEIRHPSSSIRNWKKPLLPQDHNLTEETIRSTLVRTFLRPEDTYQCMKTAADARKVVGADHGDYTRMDDSDNPSASPIMGGFDDVHDDSDDEFRADPVVDGNEVAIFGAPVNDSLTQQADLEFAGENLIEQPFTVAQVHIPFAKIAKKMDVRKLKRVMWDLLLPPEQRSELISAETTAVVNTTETLNSESKEGDGESSRRKNDPSPTPSEAAVRLAFSSLYGELPPRVSSKMANDLSQPIAFVTLLHLANEKNLRLIPKDDTKDFMIEGEQAMRIN